MEFLFTIPVVAGEIRGLHSWVANGSSGNNYRQMSQNRAHWHFSIKRARLVREEARPAPTSRT